MSGIRMPRMISICTNVPINGLTLFGLRVPFSQQRPVVAAIPVETLNLESPLPTTQNLNSLALRKIKYSLEL